jgi:hypothetical protein
MCRYFIYVKLQNTLLHPKPILIIQVRIQTAAACPLVQLLPRQLPLPVRSIFRKLLIAK